MLKFGGQTIYLRAWLRFIAGVMLCGALSSCTSMAQQADVSALATEVETMAKVMTEELRSQGETLASVQAGNANQTMQFNEALSALQLSLAAELDKCLPQIITNQTVSEQKCPTSTVETTSDRMVLGELERVRIDPPGMVTEARMDTGAQSSSLHAENITPFERDGEDWVRFDVMNGDEKLTIERPVERYVRVFQQSDKEGSRRAVVRMRILLGNLSDTFEFTLADRSHLENVMILGRNFLTDIAVVDVGRQFVQSAPLKP